MVFLYRILRDEDIKRVVNAIQNTLTVGKPAAVSEADETER